MSTGDAALESEPGAPMGVGEVPLAVPDLSDLEWQYVKDCIESGWVSSAGPYVGRFEAAVAEYLGVGHCVATDSGTAALHVALLLAGVRPGDEVLVSSLSFVAPANAIRYVGAHPVFVDAEPEFWQLDPLKAAEFLRVECEPGLDGPVDRVTGRRVRALLPVHLLGHPVDLAPLRDLAAEHRLALVEDAAQGFGASYRAPDGGWEPVGRPTGLSCLSFNGNKVVTAAGGGMVVAADPELAERARYLTTQAKADPLAYVHDEIGFNYRLSALQAAVGLAQTERAERLVEAKRRIAARYRQELSELDGVSFMAEAPWARSAYWLSTILVDPQVVPGGRDAVLRALVGEGIHARALWQPLHLSRAHAGSRATPCDCAEWLAERGLSLPSSTGLSEDDQGRVIDAIRRALG